MDTPNSLALPPAMLLAGIGAAAGSALIVLGFRWWEARHGGASPAAVVRAGYAALCLPTAAAAWLVRPDSGWVALAAGFALLEWTSTTVLAAWAWRIFQDPALASMKRLGAFPWMLVVGLLGVFVILASPLAVFLAALLGAMAGSAWLVYRPQRPADLLPVTCTEIALVASVLLLLSRLLGDGPAA